MLEYLDIVDETERRPGARRPVTSPDRSAKWRVRKAEEVKKDMIWKAKTFDELTSRELYEILKSRAEVFVKEQGISYVDEDDVDYTSIHVFGMDEDRVCAYLRAFHSSGDAGDSIKIGRVLTLEHGKGIGTELMRYAMKKLPEMMHCKRIIMDAQKRAVAFYERLGFTVTSDEYLEEGIVHVDMEIEITEEKSQ